MSKKVKIPDCMSPFEVMVNGVKRVYPPGEIVSVPDEVAVIIEQHLECHGESGEINPGGGDSVDFLDLKETLTEYRNDTITELPECAFCGCKNLKTVVLPAVTSLPIVAAYMTPYNDLFKGCTSLEVVDFTALTYFANGSAVDYDYDGAEVVHTYYTNPIPAQTKALVNRGGLFQMGAKLHDDSMMNDIQNDTGFVTQTSCYVYVPREYIKEENFAEYYDEELTDTVYPNGYDWIALYAQNRIRAIEDYTVDGTITGELDLAKMGIV